MNRDALSAMLWRMKLIHVIPISRGMTKDRLSYFSRENPPVGAIVSVPIRNKLSLAIVEGVENISDAKSRLRQSPFPIKKLESVKAESLFRPEFISAVSKMADYSAGTLGAVLNILVPKAILEDPKKASVLHTDIAGHDVSYERLVLQMDRDERFVTYKGLVREAFARGQSLFIVMPTIHDVEVFATQSEKGIHAYLFAFHSALSKKEVRQRWARALEIRHPIVVVGTGSFLSLPRQDITTIIIERESAGAYKTHVRPYLDVRTFANFLAKEIHARIVFADTFLRIETLYDRDESFAHELSPLRFRPLSPATVKIIDMKSYKPTQKGRYDIISRDLALVAEETRRKSEHLFVFSARRGLSPITVCSDCGATVTSSHSDAPMVLHKTSRGNIFFSHQNGEIRSANECCRACGGWKLVALGGGSELVEEQLKEQFPDATVLRIDSDATPTHAKAKKIAGLWQDSPGSILVGTEMALPFITDPIEHVAIASIDSLLSLPDFKITTKVFSLLLLLRSLAQKTFLLQTRNPDQRVLRDAAGGNLLDFYREELAGRKELQYPPFSLFIKLTVYGDRDTVVRQTKELEALFEGYDFRVFSAFTPAPHGKQMSHGLLKLQPSAWPDMTLLEKLRSLPPSIAVHVDPESLL